MKIETTGTYLEYSTYSCSNSEQEENLISSEEFRVFSLKK